MTDMEKWLTLKEKLENSEALLLTLLEQERPEDAQLLLETEGMRFTLPEVHLLRNALLQSMGFVEEELSDEVLETVAGGYGLPDLSSLFDPATRRTDSALNGSRIIILAGEVQRNRW